MDALSSILQDLRLMSSYYARSEVKAPWGIAFSVKDGPCFHVILSGCCWLRMPTENIFLESGDLVVLTQGMDHQLVNPLESSATMLDALPSQRIGQLASLLTFGGEGEDALLICGGVQFAGPLVPSLLELLPSVLVLHTKNEQTSEKQFEWLQGTLAMLGDEALSLRLGYATIMTRLADILVLQTIRAWFEQNTSRQIGWLEALKDHQIGHALVLIHQRAEESWTVTSLASEVAMSRSSFSEQFSRLVGMPPIKYLTRWRMYLASSWIRDDHVSPGEAAYRLGYSSEAAFSRVFKQHHHLPPGAFRVKTTNMRHSAKK